MGFALPVGSGTADIHAGVRFKGKDCLMVGALVRGNMTMLRTQVVLIMSYCPSGAIEPVRDGMNFAGYFVPRFHVLSVAMKCNVRARTFGPRALRL